MKRALFFVCLLLCFPLYSKAQAWSGILSPSRAADWSTAGVEGGIPSANWTQCGSTIAPYTGSAATINNALSACGNNQYVLLGPGTFTLSSGIQITRSNVVLRGSGADQTFLVISGNTSTSCGLALAGAIKVCTGSTNIGVTNPDHTANWTAGYSQGTTSISLDNTTGLTVGSTLFLDQLDDSSDGYPATGDLYVCSNTSNNCTNEGGGSNYARSGRTQTILTKVTGINGSTVTISPAIYLPNFRSSQSPGAWWADSAHVATDVGIEDLSLNFQPLGAMGIELTNTTNCWVKGVREIFPGGPGSFVFHVMIVNGFHDTIENNYFYGPTTSGNTQYVITPTVSGSLLIQNNILQYSVSPFVPNGPFSDSVIAYNFVTGSYYTGSGVILHNGGEMMNLYEGNNFSGFFGDIIHGTHFFDTLFRNAATGHRYNPSAYINAAVELNTNNRFFNVVGNVLGDPSFITSYEADMTGNDNVIYNLGYQGTGSGTPVTNDANVKRTLMRWGNWDTITGATRWCGDSSDTGWSTTCASTSEVPSTITNYSNPVPTRGDTGAGQQTLPASFYLSSQPSWWTSGIPWPAVGPDVTGGNISGMGGHAYLNPAANCYLNVMKGPTNGSGGALSFNEGSCYPQSQSPSPVAPTGLAAIAH